MASTKGTLFEQLNTLHTAIKDIDRETARKRSDQDGSILDNIWNIIKEVDKTKFDKKYEEEIIKLFRASILKMYNDTLQELNSDIGLNYRGGFISSGILDVEDKDDSSLYPGIFDKQSPLSFPIKEEKNSNLVSSANAPVLIPQSIKDAEQVKEQEMKTLSTISENVKNILGVEDRRNDKEEE